MLLQELLHAALVLSKRVVEALLAGPVAGELLGLQLVDRKRVGRGRAVHDVAVFAGELAELDEIRPLLAIFATTSGASAGEPPLRA